MSHKSIGRATHINESRHTCTCTHTNHELFPQPAFLDKNWCPTYIHTAISIYRYGISCTCTHTPKYRYTHTSNNLFPNTVVLERLGSSSFMHGSCHTYEWVMLHMHAHTYTVCAFLGLTGVFPERPWPYIIDAHRNWVYINTYRQIYSILYTWTHIYQALFCWLVCFE